MGRHWAQCSVYAVARGLREQHGCEWDRALEFAWEAMRMNEPMPSWEQGLARMELVQDVPVVPGRVFENFQAHFRERRGMVKLTELTAFTVSTGSGQ